jgi:hypothetical protein
MPQNNGIVLTEGPSGTQPLQSDADGNLKVAIESEIAVGAVSIAAGGVVSGAYLDGAIVTLGTEADAAYTTGSGTAISVLKGIFGKVAAVLGVKFSGLKYYTVAASQTKQTLGTGAVGDTLNSIVIVPATTTPGVVEVYDSSGGTAIVLFVGGVTSVADLKPITISLNMVSATGGWEVTTGADVSVIAIGQFTP